MKSRLNLHPILTCAQSKDLESQILVDEPAEWAAMQAAGVGIAAMIIEDYHELREPVAHLRILALIGKGNNGGDALIACGQLLADFPRARVDLILTEELDSLRPLAAKALMQLEGRVHKHSLQEGANVETISELLNELGGRFGFHVCIDGLLGMSFIPPIREPMASLIEVVNQYKRIDLRASVDLPSGFGDDSSEVKFRADFTYATGIAKKPLFGGIADCGRVRYVDLGFFQTEAGQAVDESAYVLTDEVLDPLRNLRPAAVDKRDFGHLFIIGGSAHMPGALLMSVQAAVRSGVGLVTAFAPASVAASLAAQVPEAMWVPWPETANGELSPRALPLLLDRVEQASALLVGPGLGKNRNTEMLVQEIAKLVEAPLILDADALRLRVIEAVQKRKSSLGRTVLTPHVGEYMRIAKPKDTAYSAEALMKFCQNNRVVTVLKGPHTCICDGESIYYNISGGPVLARGGSGDLLAGLIGGMIAQDNTPIETAVACGVMLHGMSAQKLARDKGQVAVHTTQVLDYLPAVLRGA